jgi:hypothetical protein
MATRDTNPTLNGKRRHGWGRVARLLGLDG